MKLTVLNEDLFLRSTGYCSNASYIGKEYEVFATSVCGTIKKKTQYLILIDDGMLLWCPQGKAVKISTDGKENWVFVPKFIEKYKKNQRVSVVLKNLHCPKWMIDEENFFYEIFENNSKAVLSLKQKINY